MVIHAGDDKCKVRLLTANHPLAFLGSSRQAVIMAMHKDLYTNLNRSTHITRIGTLVTIRRRDLDEIIFLTD
jgi:hypothetical protein